MPLWLEIAIGWSVGSAICWAARTTAGTVIVGVLARRQAIKMRAATDEMEAQLEERKATLLKRTAPKRVVGREVKADA